MIANRKPSCRADHVRNRRVKEMKQRVISAADIVKKPAPYTPITSSKR